MVSPNIMLALRRAIVAHWASCCLESANGVENGYKHSGTVKQCLEKASESAEVNTAKTFWNSVKFVSNWQLALKRLYAFWNNANFVSKWQLNRRQLAFETVKIFSISTNFVLNRELALKITASETIKLCSNLSTESPTGVKTAIRILE